MTDIINTLLSRAPRYQIKSDSDLTVTIERDDASDSIEAKLVNISVSGARFKVNQAIPAMEVLSVTIHAKRRSRKIVVSGEVCWVDLAAGDEWYLGCSFNPQIPEDLLRELSADGTIERREHQREQVSLRTTAQWELNDESASAWILNYSRGGFCLLSQLAGNPGERVRLQFELDSEQAIVVRGKIQWEVQSQEGFVIGCEFVEPRDYSVVCDIAASRIPEQESTPSRRRHWLGRWFGSDDLDGRQPKRKSLVRRSLLIAACVAILGIAAYHRLPTSATKPRQTVDQRGDSADASADVFDVVEPDGANAVGPSQNVAQPATPTLPDGASFQTGVDASIEQSRPTANVAQTAIDRDARTRHADSNSDVAAGRSRASGAPTDLKTAPRAPELRTDLSTWPIELTRAPAPSTNAKMLPGVSTPATRKLATSKPSAGIAATVGNTRAEDNSKPTDDGNAANDSRQTEQSLGNTTAARPDESARQQDAGPQSYRTWVDNTGRYQIVARFVHMEGDMVRLETKNSNYKLVSLDDLSQDDVRYVQRQITASKSSTAPK